VTLKNEAKLKEMTEVLDDLSNYVPVHTAIKTASVEGKNYTVDDSRLIRILLFGDQLTAARARGAIALRNDDTSALHRLEGFVPAVADWHARMCLLWVNKILFFLKSYMCVVFTYLGNVEEAIH